MTETFALEKLSEARRAIAEARTIPDVKLLVDQFSAMAELAKRQDMELAVQQEIAECRIWTRRKLGMLIEAMPKNNGGRPSKNHSQPASGFGKPPSLAEMGIDKDTSARVQAEAKIPSVVVDEYIEEAKATEEEITVAGMNRKAKGLTSDKVTYDGDEWHTPAEYLAAAREVMGEIELDPATCGTAQEAVQAKWALTKEDDSLAQPWYGRVWMNPPYSMPKIEQFVDKLICEFDEGRVTEAVVLVNNSSDTGWFHKLLSRFPACFTRGRVKFWHPDHDSFATRQGQTFFYLGPHWKAEVFGDVFSRFGVVVEKWRT